MDRQLSPSEKSYRTNKHPRKRKENGIRISLRLIGTWVLLVLFIATHSYFKREADHGLSRNESRGLAPDPSEFFDPVIQVYAARTWGAKGALAVHTWLAFKEKNARSYKVNQVIGWRQQGNGNVVFSEPATADKSWYGNEPMLLLDVRGHEAQELIPKIKAAIASYPWSKEYVVYPGPNSNTFISWIGQQVPELNLDLPSTAIGKDWRPLEQSFRASPSGTGVTASLKGLVGVQLGVSEGLEINLLGLHVEVDLLDLQVGLPSVGTVSIWWVILFFSARYLLFRALNKTNRRYLYLEPTDI